MPPLAPPLIPPERAPLAAPPLGTGVVVTGGALDDELELELLFFLPPQAARSRLMASTSATRYKTLMVGWW
jgi:hypothetical protein